MHSSNNCIKNIAFTIAFGDQKYQLMAKGLEKTIKMFSPNVEFIIFNENDVTPFSKGLPKNRELYPKDFKYPKIEILSKLKDANVKYMFIDADSFVFGDISPYFDFITKGEVMIEYVFNGESGWAGNHNLQFSEACDRSGIAGIKPYSINSGFIMWQGNEPGFGKALELIKNFTIDDAKGRKGDEYYINAGLQLMGAKIKALDYNKVLLGKFWNGKIGYLNNRLTSTAYPDNDRIIQHYGNNNFYSPSVQRIFKSLGMDTGNFYGLFKYRKKILNTAIKRFLPHLGKLINRILIKFGYRLVRTSSGYIIEKNMFFDEFKVYRSYYSRNEGLIIFDVGAHIGDSTAEYLKVFHQASVHCFEPAEDNFVKLQNRFKNNSHVSLNKKAIGKVESVEDFYIFGDLSTGNSLIAPTEEASSNKKEVTVISLDLYCFQNNISKIDILKIDTQGYERECLEGSADMLKHGKVGLVKVEVMFHNTYRRNTSFLLLEEILQPFGYYIVDICWIKKSSKKCRTMVVDVIYARKS